VEFLVLGGALGLHFLAASGKSVGGFESSVDKTLIPVISSLLSKAQRSSVNLVIPMDVEVGPVAATKCGVLEDEKSRQSEKDEDEESSSQEVANDGNGEGEKEVPDPAAGYDYDYEVRRGNEL